MPSDDLQKLLEGWRAAERTRDQASPDSPDWRRANAEVVRTHDLYSQAVEAQVAATPRREPDKI